ncbi:hypothetical protein [Pseudomonas sp. NPDC089396]|uniref:hypothetical protein n=1 Tax=Pseudomonas sp. NPDC089396 TaxID=3364461 RepID=UPI003835BFD3
MMFKDLTGHEIKNVRKHFRKAVTVAASPREVDEQRQEIHKITSKALKAGRLEDHSLNRAFEQVISNNWLHGPIMMRPMKIIIALESADSDEALAELHLQLDLNL